MLFRSSHSPLAEYNTAFIRLQKCRMMSPVTEALVRESLESTERETTHQIPSAHQEPEPPVPPAFDKDDSPSEPEEEPSELVDILQDLENGVIDPTLPRLTEADVAFDMDIVEEFDDYSDRSSDIEEGVDGDSDDFGGYASDGEGI